MEISEVFRTLNQKLEELRLKSKQSSVNPEELQAEVEDLKDKSEEIVEEWLAFEEKLGEYFQEYMQLGFGELGDSSANTSGATGQEYNDEQETYEHLKELYKNWYELWSTDPAQAQQALKTSVDHSSENWRKGQALYDLYMFKQAIPYLERVVAEEPELEVARLFLAHSYLAVNQKEQATRQLQFLSETSFNKDMTHLALHGLACLTGALKEYERSITYFKKIKLDEVRVEWLPIFISNYALSLFRVGNYEECLKQWEKYTELMPYDWRGPYMLGRVHLALGDAETAVTLWFEALQLEESPAILLAMAKHFEQKAFHTMAAQCYERMLKNHIATQNVQTWFGLAWNQGLSQRREQAEESFLKALSLFPKHIELQLAYTWMLLYWQDKEKGLKSLLALQERYSEHPLVLGLAYVYEGKFGEANEVLTAHLHAF